MREIKFRAWDSKLKKMFEGVTHIGKYKCNEKEKIWTLMQCTGLKDINGKEIYEGDVIEFENPYRRDKCLVEFKDGRFNLCQSQLYEGDGEVIGNIYENPKEAQQ